MVLGELIQAWRKAKQVSLRRLARTLEVDQQIVWRLEHGKPVSDRNLVRVLVWTLDENHQPKEK